MWELLSTKAIFYAGPSILLSIFKFFYMVFSSWIVTYVFQHWHCPLTWSIIAVELVSKKLSKFFKLLLVLKKPAQKHFSWGTFRKVSTSFSLNTQILWRKLPWQVRFFLAQRTKWDIEYLSVLSSSGICFTRVAQKCSSGEYVSRLHSNKYFETFEVSANSTKSRE